MFTLLDSIFCFLNRSGTTQEGSQGLWEYPQPTFEAPRDQEQHQQIIFIFWVRHLKSLLPGQGEFDFRIPKG